MAPAGCILFPDGSDARGKVRPSGCGVRSWLEAIEAGGFRGVAAGAGSRYRVAPGARSRRRTVRSRRCRQVARAALHGGEAPVVPGDVSGAERPRSRRSRGSSFRSRRRCSPSRRRRGEGHRRAPAVRPLDRRGDRALAVRRGVPPDAAPRRGRRRARLPRDGAGSGRGSRSTSTSSASTGLSLWIGRQLARVVPVDLPLLHGAAIGHDIGKFGCVGDEVQAHSAPALLLHPHLVPGPQPPRASATSRRTTRSGTWSWCACRSRRCC